MKVVTVALVILLVVAGVLLVMAVNKSDETGDNNTPEGQNTQNMPYPQNSDENTSTQNTGPEVTSPNVQQK